MESTKRMKFEAPVAEKVVVAPVWGTVSIAGRMRVMEDTVMVCMDLCRPEIAQFHPVHFFAVFDGHGGSHVSTLCKEKLHTLVKDELMRVTPSPRATDTPLSDEEDEEDLLWKQTLKQAFKRMEDLSLSSCACRVVSSSSAAEHSYECATSTVGSTATAAIVTPDKIIVANCGDSRAVLCRGDSRDFPLSADHESDRPDELARIEATGRRVMRVQGVLAMSRAKGDKFLKPVVISEPEITITRRDQEDECIIIASDGFWDVIPNHVACKVASQSLQGANIPIGGLLDAACTGLEEECPTLSARVAALLTYLALAKNSTDNISVIVVDLKSR